MIRLTSSRKDLGWALGPAFLFFCASAAEGATRTWQGSGGSPNWSSAANWSGGVVPGASDIAKFNFTSSANCTIDTDVKVLGISITTAYGGVITLATGKALAIGTTGFTMNGGAFIGGNSTITDSGDFILRAGGTFTSTSGMLTISGNATIKGKFTHNGGTLTLTGGDKAAYFGTAVLKHLIYATGGNSVTLTGTATVSGDFTISSVNYMNGGTIAVAGNVISNDTNLIGYPATVILINGSGNQSLTAGIANAEVPSVQINKPGGTLSVVGPISVFNDWTHTAGTVAFDSQPLQFVGFDKTVTAGTIAYNHVVYDTGGNSITTVGTMNVTGTFTINSINYMNGGTIACKGNVVTKDNSLIGYPATVVQIDGTVDQTLSANGSYNLLPSLKIMKTGGKLTLLDTIGVFNDFTYTSGNVDAGNSTVKFVGFDKTVTSTTAMVFKNVEVNTGGNSIMIAGNVKTSGDFTITSANYFQNGTLNVGGNLTSSAATINSWNGTSIVLDGSGDQLITSTSGGVFPRNITVNKTRCTGGDARLATDLALSQNGQCLYVASGAFNLQGHKLTVNGSSSKFIIQRGGILKLDSGAVISTPVYYPEVQCGSMVAVNSGGTYSFPSSTISQINGVGGNTNWTQTQSCVQADTPAYCPGIKTKITRWREVKNAS